MKIISKISKILLWIVLIIVALYSTIIIVQKLIFKDKTPSFMGYKNFIVLTGSMKPALNIGDIVIVKETDNIKKGDIISFKNQESVVTHRVYEIRKENGKDYYITKGDANSGTDDDLLSIEDIEGKYCFKIPFIGSIILFLQKPIGIIILFSILVFCLLLSSLKTDKEQEE